LFSVAWLKEEEGVVSSLGSDMTDSLEDSVTTSTSSLFAVLKERASASLQPLQLVNPITIA
jgi:hypothetical protein